MKKKALASIHQTSKALVNGELSESEIRSLATTTIHMAIRSQGLDSAVELVMSLGDDQFSRVLDLDLWDYDRFHEDSFWQWLSALNCSLDGLSKLFRCIREDVICLIIARYVDAIVNEEPTDAPPGDGYYTPDRGYTWLGVKVLDPDHHVLLCRLLAFCVEARPEFFYQLLATATACTPSEFEERGFQERSKTLLAEDIPDFAMSMELHKPLPASVLSLDYSIDDSVDYTIDRAEDPAISTTLMPTFGRLDPLQGVIAYLLDYVEHEAIERELALLTGAALVFGRIPHYDIDAVEFCMDQVKGILNIGIEAVLRELLARSEPERSTLDRSTGGESAIVEQALDKVTDTHEQNVARPIQGRGPETIGFGGDFLSSIPHRKACLAIYRTGGLTALYRVGLHEISVLRSKALKIHGGLCGNSNDDKGVSTTDANYEATRVEALSARFPYTISQTTHGQFVSSQFISNQFISGQFASGQLVSNQFSTNLPPKPIALTHLEDISNELNWLDIFAKSYTASKNFDEP